MKEISIQDIRSIEDGEMRSLVRYEHLIAWGKSGGVKRAVAAFRSQIASAEQAKAVAKLRVAQINVIEKAVACFAARAVRDSQMAEVAAKHRADAAERHAIQAAVDEVLALEEIVAADDIDDILSTVSAVLTIDCRDRTLGLISASVAQSPWKTSSASFGLHCGTSVLPHMRTTDFASWQSPTDLQS